MKHPKFLLAPDKETRELYILHREYPACLVWVKQTLPTTFEIVDIFDDMEGAENELPNMPVMEEMKTFLKQNIQTNGN